MRYRSPRRRGNVLVLFGMLTFVVLGLSALVIDLGLARTTQRPMQTAADAAALEGLRGRDLYLTDPGMVDAPASDQKRRAAASTLASYVFNDSLATDQDPQRFSAGPVVTFTGGIPVGTTNFLAAQDYGPPGAYKPILQLNSGDLIEGDMVAGSYTDGPAVLHQEQGLDSGTPFARDDFTPRASSTQANLANAFLVRLRRSDDPMETGVSSTGPPLPFLFGRGSLLAPDAKARGILVRATGIANAVPAQSVGQPVTAAPDGTPLQPALPGLTPFVLQLARWQDGTSLPPAQALTVLVNADGTLTLPNANQAPIGSAIAPLPWLSLASQPPPDPSNPFVPSTFVSNMLTQAARGYGYVPIIDALGTPPTNLVVGFGFVNLAADPASASQFLMTVQLNRIAPDNASAVVLGTVTGAQVQVGVTPPQLAAVLPDHQSMAGSSLLTPVVVRSTGPAGAPK